MADLLLEIGAEEIPAEYIEPALEALASKLSQKLSAARIDHGKSRTFGTPRRLTVMVADVAAKQQSLAIEVTGPPQKIAFDPDGNPTTAAVKFAEKLGVAVHRLKIKETKKGAYVCGIQKEKGLATRSLLREILPEVILATPFPKTMRWADLSIEFARPIQSILALFGSSIISFDVGKIKSGRYSFGHRFKHPQKIKISSPDAYLDALREAYVIADIAERKALIEKEIKEAAASVGGTVLHDPGLLDIVTNLVEYHAVSVGNFDQDFLQIPDEVLITAMREHQKYFAVIDRNDRLMSYFIAVNNTPARDMAVVAKGHERVLRARLEDARFFFTTDMDVAIDDQVDKLKSVLFQAKLGSVYDKIKRIESLSDFIAEQVSDSAELRKHVTRSAYLCKADLVTQMVGEFPKLQGIMGRVYAQAQGESVEVANAIEEHYRPVFSGAALPETTAGAIVSIADKIDSICGCFSVGLIPTGTADPYALRRQGIGIIQIMLSKNFAFSLSGLIETSVNLFSQKATGNLAENTDKINKFLKNRMANLLADEGFSKDAIASVISVSADAIPNVWNRVRALDKLKAKPDFESLMVGFKRIVNIIRKTENFQLLDVDRKLFEHDSEAALFAVFNNVSRLVNTEIKNGDFDQALVTIASLKDPVDAFFDGVLVMAEDEKVRLNRLSLLGHIAALFEQFADFSKIST